jgi:outer membrane protein
MMRVSVLALFTAVLFSFEARGQNASTSDPPATDREAIQLLDEIPNYAEILRTQWGPDVPPAVRSAEESVDHYGQLLDVAPLQATSLQEAIALALRYNTDLRIQRLGPVSAAAGVRGARAQFDPALFADINKSRNVTPATSALFAGAAPFRLTQNFNADTGLRKGLLSGGVAELRWTNNRLVTNPSVATPLVPLYTTTLGLSLNQPLLRGFGWRYSLLIVEVAETTAESAYRQYEAAVAALIAQVERAYWILVLAIQTVTVEEQGLALALELQRQNEGRFNVGALPQTAVLEAKAEVARRESVLIRARNLRDNQRDNLRAIINARDPDAAALLNIEPQDRPQVVPFALDLERSLRTALEARPELQAARLDVRGKGLERKIAENQLLPKLNFVGAIGVNGVGGTDQEVLFGDPPAPVPANPTAVGGYGSALGLLTDGRFYDYLFGATIEIPLDNAQAKADYAQANINFDQSRLSLQRLQESVTLEIKQAVSNLQTDLKSIEATRIARELAEENLRNQQARYDVGLATTKDILDFQDQLTRARFAEIEALTRYNIDVAELRRVEGSLLEARNVVVARVSAGDPPWWARF